MESATLQKVATGIRGFDTITNGGVPAARASLVVGGAGCGKTLFGLAFLLHGAELGEPGVLFALEERETDIVANAASLGADVPALVAADLLRIDDIHLDAVELDEIGDWNLDGLLVRMQASIDEIGAKRVVIDTIETLFSAFEDHSRLRREMVRVVRWLKERNVTAIITAEAQEGPTLTRRGIEQYVSDCVIVLDHRVIEQVSTRRLRIVKYRGSGHGTNEYPFLIDGRGLAIQPITSVALDYEAPTEIVSSGVPDLDRMLAKGGYYRGSTVLLSGTAGAGKTSVAMSAVIASAERGESALVFAFEESPSQIRRNMASIGLDFAATEESGLILIHAARPTLHGLERHLLDMLRIVEELKPRLVVIDPVSSFSDQPTGPVAMLVMRLIDGLRARSATVLLTYLADSSRELESTVVGISSIADIWILMRPLERNGRRLHSIHVAKARGMAHSNAIGEIVISDKGVGIAGLDEDVAP